MRKLAFFVEGQTEQLFVETLVEACAEEYNVKIESKRGHLGRKYERIFIEIGAKKIGTGEDFFVLIIDSGSDERVVSDIKDRFDDLVRQNYSMIVGLRDVRPEFSRQEIEKLQAGIESSIATLTTIPIEFYLSIMEVEAWFLAENTHFLRIDPKLTEERIVEELGFFPDNKNAESREIPSADLAAIYNIGGIRYDKSRPAVKRVMDSLDFEDIMKVHSIEIRNLGGVVNGVSDFFQT